MNRTKIKYYAPQARRDFIQAVKDRSAFYGLTDGRIEAVTVKGDVAIIAGRAFPREVADKRKALQERVERDGYEPTMEALAYTWFNRLVAIRYMELHGYLDHGYRVLSNPDPAKAMPEILEHAEHVELPGLSRDRVIELKLDGTKEADLYRMLLVAQCNALHSAMPFLFERIGDETELVLPESLLHSDSIVRKLVSGIDEEDWQEVEIIGWLYEAYICERYEAVIGSVVASADIPAATQRFTPKWIVRYLVQNTLGRLWLATYPQSPLKAQMKYYIEPAEQTPEVQEQLRAITPTSLNPEEITFLDPACGSAHILVEAYDLFKAIYQERGYRAKEIPRMILGKNLFGLEIDDRAAQLAAFALMMKARADDRRIFDQGIQPHVRALVQVDGMDAEDIAAALTVSPSKETAPPGLLFETDDNLFTRAASTTIASPKVALSDVKALIGMFGHAKTFGSLIQVPPSLAARLPQIERCCREVAGQTAEIASRTATRFLPVVEQATMLANHYDAVVTNPPYMGTRYCNNELKSFLSRDYEDEKGDLCVCFIRRGLSLAKATGRAALVTMHSWMFLSSFSAFRRALLVSNGIESMAHLGARAFGNISGEVVQVTAFVCHNAALPDFTPTFLRLVEGEESAKDQMIQCGARRYASTLQSAFTEIPGSPLAYWISRSVRLAFANHQRLGSLVQPRQGLATSDDGRFLRYWHEVSFSKVNTVAESLEDAKASAKKWFPFLKGGECRKWYGNLTHVINWENGGEEVIGYASKLYGSATRTIKNMQFYFLGGITWSLISGGFASFRVFPKGCIIGHKGPGIFSRSDQSETLLLLLNSSAARLLLEVLSPTLGFEVGHLQSLPACLPSEKAHTLAPELIRLHQEDWDSRETSWDFQVPAFCQLRCDSLGVSFDSTVKACQERIDRAKWLEESNNRLFIEAYGLQDELSPEVPDEQITLYRLNREEDIKRLISYAIGCTMGRYSLDTPGLIYAHGGDVGFDPGQYRTFTADPDGIVPVLESDWFTDDATHRFVEFLGVAWPEEHLEENLKFVAESLGPSRGEQPRDTIHRYLATGFYKHHLQTYKRRPIYWLFSSGKQRAFQCLVYLHRYHEGTLSRMRTEYVIPLQGKLASRIDHLAIDSQKATSHRKKLMQERDILLKQQAELQAYDEKLRHYADMRISLDLDDGVKVNYGKFGDLLADVRAVTGARED